jgi:hypothetical protein
MAFGLRTKFLIRSSAAWPSLVKEIVKDDAPMPATYDDIVAMVASVVAAASRLPFRDQQRVRDVVHAAGSLLSARTRIDDGDDRRKFESEIHKALTRQG